MILQPFKLSDFGLYPDEIVRDISDRVRFDSSHPGGTYETVNYKGLFTCMLNKVNITINLTCKIKCNCDTLLCDCYKESNYMAIDIKKSEFIKILNNPLRLLI